MNVTIAKSVPIAERILDTFPSGSYALSALLRLMDIVESTAVPTAAVECRIQPRLLINPDFVANHAPTAEKLLMLVMHELHHVLLGHTTLFPRVTMIQNFVFDAVINGLVCRMFDDEAHTAFFTDYYDADSFPACLLRPPPGWPSASTTAPGIEALPEPQRGLVAEIHGALYSITGATYKEVFDVLPKLVVEGAIANIPLIGEHGEIDNDGTQLESRSPLLFDVVREIVEQWPQPPDPIRGRSLADIFNESHIRPHRAPSSRSVLRNLIRKVAGRIDSGASRRLHLDQAEIMTPIPVLGRRTLVQRALGFEPLLYTDRTMWRCNKRYGQKIHVYIDVSGSMNDIKETLYAAVLDCLHLVQPVIHLFSTKIADISLEEFRRGVCRSTGGTDIACVAEHMSANGVHRALLVTDGWVGMPNGRHRDILTNAKLAVAFLGTDINRDDLAHVADYSATLLIGDQP